MRNRKIELMQYLKTLVQLKDTCVDCDDKIRVVLEELHREMGFVNGINVSTSVITKLTNEEIEEMADKAKKTVSDERAKDSQKNPFDSIE